MNKLQAAGLLYGLAFLTTGFSQEQTTQPSRPSSGTDSPSAASSPHQREATSSAGSEAPASTGTSPGTASSPHQQEATQNLSKTDTDGFVQKAAQDGMTEVELGKLVMEKSQNESVRAFAQHMVQDHGKANTELSAIAQKKNLNVPKQLDAQHQKMVQELSSKSGAAFDAAYAEHMAADHAKAVALFKSASALTDPELAGFAKKTLPTLQEHKKMADSLTSKIRTASAGQ